tara:strand:- start:2160 stop:4223 length:2064 start_codon:yes stop_codon:yes gene_type:complete
MASFTVEQNIEGAGAYSQGVVPQKMAVSGATGVLSSLVQLGDTYARAEARTKAANAPTQTDRDRSTIAGTLRSAQADLAKGMSKDEVGQKYAVTFATLDMNEQERALAVQMVGDVFAVPVQPTSTQDTTVELWNSQPDVVRAGLVDIEIAAAAANGEKITPEEAQSRAIQTNQADLVSANAGILQGNQNYMKGFAQNMQTLDSFGNALVSALNVEIEGGNFNLEDLQRMRGAILSLKGQPAFQKPTGVQALALWSKMETKLQSFDAIFGALEDYDAKDATAKAKSLMAQISLNLAKDDPLAILAMSSPEVMIDLAAKLKPSFAAELSTMSETPTVRYSDLNFDPAVLEAMGLGESGEIGTGTGSVPPINEPFPASLSEAYKTIEDEGFTVDNKEFTGALTSNRELISAFSQSTLKTPESIEAFASVVTSQAYLLSKVESRSAANLDGLFAENTIGILNSMSKQGGEQGRISATLRAQMGAALERSRAVHAVAAAGMVDRIPSVGIVNDKWALTGSDTPEVQQLQAVADLYYNGDFEAMWKQGTTAQSRLQNRLAATGDITPNSPEYTKFLASTEVLKSAFWTGLSGRYNTVKGIPERIAQFKDYGKKIGVDVTQVEEDQAFATEAADTAVNAITQTDLPPSFGVKVNPYVYKGTGDAEGPEGLAYYNSIPAGAYYVDPADGLSYRKQ